MKALSASSNFFNSRYYIGIFLLRLFIGLRLLYGVIDNVVSWEQMMEFSYFLQANNIPFPTVSAVISVYVQLVGGLMLLLGFRIRMASAVLIFNFIVALFVHLQINDSIEGMTPALAMLFGCLTFLFTGAGKISVENRKRKDL